jgi:hypothetical protein
MLNLNRTPTWDRELYRVSTHRPFSSFGDLLGRFFFARHLGKKMPAETRAFLFLFFYLDGQQS